MPANYNAGQSPSRQVLVDPNTLTDITPPVAGPSGELTTRELSKVGTDRSKTATTSSQELMAANANRTKFYVKNDAVVDVWVNLGATASAVAGSGNIKVAASGGYLELSGYSGVVNIIAASSTAAVTAREL